MADVRHPSTVPPPPASDAAELERLAKMMQSLADSCIPGSQRYLDFMASRDFLRHLASEPQRLANERWERYNEGYKAGQQVWRNALIAATGDPGETESLRGYIEACLQIHAAGEPQRIREAERAALQRIVDWITTSIPHGR